MCSPDSAFCAVWTPLLLILMGYAQGILFFLPMLSGLLARQLRVLLKATTVVVMVEAGWFPISAIKEKLRAGWIFLYFSISSFSLSPSLPPSLSHTHAHTFSPSLLSPVSLTLSVEAVFPSCLGVFSLRSPDFPGCCNRRALSPDRLACAPSKPLYPIRDSPKNDSLPV